ncbi:pyrimidine dimer DNA glycosylase/endonuclease V [Lysinibacillus sp. BW-2-10]|uniref:pyrimidine dimer DNA glycosylase/endonuclease V n=1 Tax=Lysinibacillus sp. BW-2-10 TaxID=2590030 RepID=UPI00117C1D04|nr:pyrimidine dimer DNA glycosylase/endonuclease V [Lysinibacillus sp. BW-2-10]TSI02262.1 neutral trehalase [Lysinibacillus sp. BW-2-10]
MRLWHIDTIPFLPRGQLLAQWRELNSIFKKEDQHILINYIYEYEKVDLLLYTNEVLNEMKKRGFKIKTFDKLQAYFEGIELPEKPYKPFTKHHNDEYLEICYFNLKEKYIRGQKDYDDNLFHQLDLFYQVKIQSKS